METLMETLVRGKEWTIEDLNQNKMEFNVPSYQRGYKWTDEMVQYLLEDIAANSRHCLQSLTIKWSGEDNKWEVVDGQQRLTTIFILQQALRKNEEDCFRNFFILDYNSREPSKKFVDGEIKSGNIFSIDNCYDEECKGNQDIHYFCQAAKRISKWLQDQKNNRAELEKNLNSAYFLINITKENSETVFANLNSGRVLLTDIELLKADILINITQNEINKTLSGKRDDDRISRQVAINEMRTKYGWMWDEMELWISQPEVLNWISPKKNQKDHPTNKLKLLFGLFLSPIEDETLYGAYCRQKKKEGLRLTDEKLWFDICNAFETIKDWYLDNELYHWVGFLIASKEEKERFSQLTKLYCETYLKESTGRQALKNKLKAMAMAEYGKSNTIDIENVLDELTYGDPNHRHKINNFLLLLNCLEIAGHNLDFNSGRRYRFDLHNSEQWSLEHIFPQNPKGKDINKDYIDKIKDYFDNLEKTDDELKIKFNDFYNMLLGEKGNITDNQKERIKKFVQELSLHGMNNMALLSKEINSSLGNGLFHDKREKIFNLIAYGAFIPPLTSKLFSKTFPGAITTSLYWTPQDTKSYEAYQKKLLNLFSTQAAKK